MHTKNCMAPDCSNNDRKSSKVFLRIGIKEAPKWCALAGIHFNPKTEYFCCEDHLKLEEAVINYQYWKTMGGQPRLNKNYVPNFVSNKENCPSSHQLVLQTEQEGSELRRLLVDKNIPNKTVNTKVSHEMVETFIPEKVQVGVQCKPKTKNKAVNYRCKNIKYCNIKPQEKKEKDDEVLTSQDSVTSNIDTEFNPSTNGSTTEIEVQSVIKSPIALRNNILELIQKHPKFYIGLPKPYYWTINYIASEFNIDYLHIIIALYKIKQNDTFLKISHHFQVTRLTLSKIFPAAIATLANFFQNFIYFPDLKTIKKNLPSVFKVRFSNVQCILDCFEIEIEKPSNPQNQSRTWSQYKNCNTVKYLVGCTPDGFINFISKGYSGRISDKAIFEKSNLIEILPENAVIMADRGFKAVESLLVIKNVKLLRPPSVYSASKPTKEEVLATKVIASLRVHVERLIRRLREFNMLKPHSVIKNQHLGYLDEIVLIVCGLCNLQSKIIKDH